MLIGVKKDYNVAQRNKKDILFWYLSWRIEITFINSKSSIFKYFLSLYRYVKKLKYKKFYTCVNSS